MQHAYTAVLQQVAELHPEFNFLEKTWLAYYQWFGNDVVATGIMSFVLHELFYFGRCVPWIIIDQIEYFKKWKIQPERAPTSKEQWECTKLVLFSHFTIELPQIWLFHPICSLVGLQLSVPFPSIGTMATQIALFMFLEDAWHFWIHWSMHWGPLYRYIHKIHHKYAAPFGLAAEYAHPLETLVLGIGTIGFPIFYCYLTNGGVHLVTVYIWVILRLFQAIDSHSGYDFPWSLNKFFPMWSGADGHDYHHMAFTDNYSSSFRWWDALLGTDKKYKRWKAKQMAKQMLKEN